MTHFIDLANFGYAWLVVGGSFAVWAIWRTVMEERNGRDD